MKNNIFEENKEQPMDKIPTQLAQDVNGKENIALKASSKEFSKLLSPSSSSDIISGYDNIIKTIDATLVRLEEYEVLSQTIHSNQAVFLSSLPSLSDSIHIDKLMKIISRIENHIDRVEKSVNKLESYWNAIEDNMDDNQLTSMLRSVLNIEKKVTHIDEKEFARCVIKASEL